MMRINLPAPHESMRRYAAEALSRLGWQAEPALPVLLTALSGDDRYALPGILKALGAIGPEAAAAVPRLLELLHAIPRTKYTSPEQDIRLDLVNTIGAIGPRAARAVPTLVELALTNESHMPYEAKLSLAKIGVMSVDSTKRLLANDEVQDDLGYQYWSDFLRSPGGAAIEPLILRWVTAKPMMRLKLEDGLNGTMSAPNRTPTLITLVHHRNNADHRSILSFLAHCRPRPAWIADELDTLLTTHDPDDTFVWLQAVTDDPPRCALHLQGLIDLARDPATAPPACRAIRLAAPLGNDQIALMTSLLSSPEPALHLAAARALAQQLTANEQALATTQAIAAIARVNAWWQFTIAAEILSALPADPHTAIALRHHFDAGDAMHRRRLLPAFIHQLRPEHGTDLLISLLSDSDPAMVAQACELLSIRGPHGRRALPMLRWLAWAPQGPFAEDAWCAIAALDAEENEAFGEAAALAWRGDSLSQYRISSNHIWQYNHALRLKAIAALTVHPVLVPALHHLGEMLANDPDPDIAAAGKALADRHR